MSSPVSPIRLPPVPTVAASRGSRMAAITSGARKAVAQVSATRPSPRVVAAMPRARPLPGAVTSSTAPTASPPASSRRAFRHSRCGSVQISTKPPSGRAAMAGWLCAPAAPVSRTAPRARPVPSSIWNRSRGVPGPGRVQTATAPPPASVASATAPVTSSPVPMSCAAASGAPSGPRRRVTIRSGVASTWSISTATSAPSPKAARSACTTAPPGCAPSTATAAPTLPVAGSNSRLASPFASLRDRTRT